MQRLHVVFYHPKPPYKCKIHLYEDPSELPLEKLRSNDGESVSVFFRKIGKSPQDLLEVSCGAFSIDLGPPPFAPGIGQQDGMQNFWYTETMGARRRNLTWQTAILRSAWLPTNTNDLQAFADFCNYEVNPHRLKEGDSDPIRICEPLKPQ